MKQNILILLSLIFVTSIKGQDFALLLPEGITMSFSITSRQAKTCAVFGRMVQKGNFEEGEEGSSRTYYTCYPEEYDERYVGHIEIPPFVTYEGVEYKVTAIYNYSFYMKMMTSISIPSTVTRIGKYAFEECSNLEQIYFSTGLNIIEDHAFFNCSQIESLVFPNGLQDIGAYAFSGCSNLSSIVLPNTINNIQEFAFENCMNLYSITSLINIPFILNEKAFIYTGSKYNKEIIYWSSNLYVPNGKKNIYSLAGGWDKFLNILETDTKYVLSYIVDNTLYKTYEIQATEIVTPEPDPYQAGFVFSGWSTIPKIMPAHDVVVYGHFTPSVGIKNTTSNTLSHTDCYTLNGQRLSQPQKGINVIRISDGTTRKVLVK